MLSNIRITPISLGDLMQEPPIRSQRDDAPPGTAVLGNLIRKGDVAVIRGKHADAVSCVATCLDLMIAGDWKRDGSTGPQRCWTLYLDGQNALHKVRRRVARFVPHTGPLTVSVQKSIHHVLPAEHPELLLCWLDEAQGQKVVEEALHGAEIPPAWGEGSPLVLVVDNVGAWLSDAGTHVASVRKFLHWLMQMRGRGVTFLLVDIIVPESPMAGRGLIDGISNLVIDATKLKAPKTTSSDSGFTVQLKFRQHFRDKRPALTCTSYRLDVPAKGEGQQRFAIVPHQEAQGKKLSDDQVREAHRQHLEEDKTLRELAKDLKVGIKTLRYAFAARNLSVRSRGPKAAPEKSGSLATPSSPGAAQREARNRIT